MNFRVKDHARKVMRRRAKKYERFRARKFDRMPTKRKWRNWWKYMR